MQSGHRNGERGCVQNFFHFRNPPHDHQRGQQQEWRPRMQDLPGGMRVSLIGARRLARIAPDLARLPGFEEQRQRNQGHHAASDVHQRRVSEVRPIELDRREDSSADRQAGPHGERVGPGGHRSHQPERQQHRGPGQDSADHRAQVRFAESSHRHQRADRIAHPAESHRCRVGDQTQNLGRLAAEPGQGQEVDLVGQEGQGPPAVGAEQDHVGGRPFRGAEDPRLAGDPDVSPPIESLIVVKWPVSTVTS